MIDLNSFADVFGPLSSYVEGRIQQYAPAHRLTTREERDHAFLDMVKAVYHNELPVSGPARHPIWEQGWDENLAEFDPAKAGRELARPHYYNKYPVVRWMGDLYVPTSEDYEHNMLALIQDWVFDKYLRDVKCVCEFGCGTGHNLFRVRDVNPNCSLVGLDWAESAVKFINLQALHGAYKPGSTWAAQFDFFNPTNSAPVAFSSETAFITVASLEQVGNRWKPFFDYVMEYKPKIVIHIEPIEEVLNPEVLLDHLSLGYFRKRGYLSGWLRQLITAHELNRITLHEVLRTHIGSKFIEGYTVLVWSPTPASTQSLASAPA